MPIDLSQVNLDAPAFSAGQSEESVPAEGSQPQRDEVARKEEAQPTDGGKPSESDQSVPYSRLKEVVEARREAEQRALEAEARYEALQRAYPPQPQASPDTMELPNYWVRMYGDNENSRMAYKYELERQESIREEARREALEAVRQEREFEVQGQNLNIQSIDSRIEDLSYQIGRPLTEQEEGKLLDIVDEFTPTGRDGKYAGDLISFDRAWEIMQMREQSTRAGRNEARRTPTVLTSSKTESESLSDREENNKSFNPLDWNAYKKRVS